MNPTNYIVLTTINKPTIATIKFSQMKDWKLIVVGDLKTPGDLYKELNCIYLSPEEQQEKYPSLSKTIGWRSIQRRNVGFVEAYNCGATVVATVDDDNIPYDNWGQNLLIDKNVSVDYYETDNIVFDPLSVTNCSHLWHRGFPMELLQKRHQIEYKGKKQVKVQIQADLWDGDPDIDAICRLTHKPLVKFDTNAPFTSNRISPFNSQNTFISRELIPYYAVLPQIGRMDDIWASYMLQQKHPGLSVVYNTASVYQERNPQDLIVNLEKEVIGYRNTFNFICCGCYLDQPYIPEGTRNFYNEYRACFTNPVDTNPK